MVIVVVFTHNHFHTDDVCIVQCYRMLAYNFLLSFVKSAHGQEIISVTDLEDDSVSQTPVQRQALSPPTSAQLHLLAASVVNSTETRTEAHTNESPGI